MKKSLFVLGTALLASTSAFAMDVTNPFYVPMKGDFLSDTSAIYQNWEDGDVEQALFVESLSYGITNRLSIVGTVANGLMIDAKGIHGHELSDNPAWAAGLKYNLIDCCKTNWKVQLAADYTQGLLSLDPKTVLLPIIFAPTNVNHHSKSVTASAKVGYQLKDGFLPYVTATFYKPVGGMWESNPSYIGRVAAYKTLGKHVSVDAGASYMWSNSTNFLMPNGKHYSHWNLDATLNYAFSDCMSVGLTGNYALKTKSEDVDYYSVGVNFKVAF